MEPHEKVTASLKKIFIRNFVGGIGWALGATIGLAVIFALLSYILSQVNLIPILGNFIASIIREVLQKHPNLIK